MNVVITFYHHGNILGWYLSENLLQPNWLFALHVCTCFRSKYLNYKISVEKILIPEQYSSNKFSDECHPEILSGTGVKLSLEWWSRSLLHYFKQSLLDRSQKIAIWNACFWIWSYWICKLRSSKPTQHGVVDKEEMTLHMTAMHAAKYSYFSIFDASIWSSLFLNLDKHALSSRGCIQNLKLEISLVLHPSNIYSLQKTFMWKLNEQKG